MNPDPVIALLQALLTPTIAVATTVIAYQQYRIRRDERALQLYDRRLKVYKSAMLMIDRIRAGHLIDMSELWEWVSSIQESHFLFGAEVQEVIEPLFSKLLEFADLAEPLKNTSDLFDSACASVAVDIEGYRTPLEEVFRPYLLPTGEGIFKKRRYSRRRIRKFLKQCTSPVGYSQKPRSAPLDEEVPF